MSNNYVGLDGCRAGWIAAVISEKHGQIQLFSTIEDACMHNQRCERVLIDIPIGLAANKQEAVMRPEPAARKVLGKRASCIFNAPCKQAVYAKVIVRQMKSIRGSYIKASASNPIIFLIRSEKQIFFFIPFLNTRAGCWKAILKFVLQC